MLKILISVPIALIVLGVFVSCNSTDTEYSTIQILSTSEGGDKMATKENVSFVKGIAKGTVIKVEPNNVKQTIDGIGSSFTESSAKMELTFP
jgi:O-glycosyl hydrolase